MIKPVLVLEYNGKRVKEWESIIACARAHHVSATRIKELIYYGDALKGLTFDIAMHCPVDIVRKGEKLVLTYQKSRQIAITPYVRKEYSAVHQGSLMLPCDIAL